MDEARVLYLRMRRGGAEWPSRRALEEALPHLLICLGLVVLARSDWMSHTRRSPRPQEAD